MLPGSSGSCFVYSEANCTTFSNAALRRDFSAVVFNVGMHYLRNVEGRATSWNDYAALLTQCAQRVASAYPQARLVYMLTNSICEDKWDGPFNAQRKRMRSIEASEATPSDKYLMQWGRIGTDTINMAERVVVPSLSNGPRRQMGADRDAHVGSIAIAPRCTMGATSCRLHPISS